MISNSWSEIRRDIVIGETRYENEGSNNLLPSRPDMQNFV